MLARFLALTLSIAGVTGVLTPARSAAQNQAGTILAPGSPPLTSDMVDHRVAVWEAFLQVHFTDDQKVRLRDAMITAWRKHDKDEIQQTLGDLKYYGQQAQIDSTRSANQANFVENLRAHPKDEECITLLEAFEAAHPDRKDVMSSRGYGDLIGTWSRGDALPSQRNPLTGRLEGISFSESSVLKIFSDGRFQHAWLHHHCPDGDRCCTEYATTMQGGISVEGQTLVLSGQSGDLVYKNPCAPNTSTTKSLGPQRETVGWSLKHDRGENAPLLCLEEEPFPLPGQTQHNAVCYTKQHE
jgi:Spy/CpxP family protein refolding chaperone